MSAIPKRKLCWNCEGNVVNHLDNCPYCGVYLNVSPEEDLSWNPNYQQTEKLDEIPIPPYQSKTDLISDLTENIEAESHQNVQLDSLFSQLKRDIFPILFLMAGSLFFLFGIVLVLFSQNGKFTLQWEEADALFYLSFSFPLLILGWYLFQKLE